MNPRAIEAGLAWANFDRPLGIANSIPGQITSSQCAFSGRPLGSCNDGYPGLIQIVRPQLSSVRVPMAEVGTAAVKSLIHRLDRPESRPTCVRLPTKLVLRESSGV